MHRVYNSFFLIFCFGLIRLPMSYAIFNAHQMESLPLIKVLNGFKPEDNIDIIQYQIDKFSLLSHTILNVPYDQNESCLNYFNATDRLTAEIIESFQVALAYRSDSFKKFYAQARLEILADLFYKIGALGMSEAEGGITPFLHQKSKCVSGDTRRDKWLRSIKLTQNTMQIILKLLFGSRNFKTTFDLSNFLANEKLGAVEKDWESFLLTTGASVVVFPLAIKFLTLQFGKAAVAMTSGLGGAYAGMKYGGSFFSIKPEIILEINKRLYTQIDKIIDTKLESPDLYFPFIFQLEETINSFFMEVLTQYKRQYQTSLSICIAEGNSKNCHMDWYKYL